MSGDSSVRDRLLKLDWATAIVANLLILGVWAYAAFLRETAKDFYYRSAQEDEYLEWGTFWAFLVAAVICGLATHYQRRSTGQLPWFLAGVSAFCFIVAMEEISWGQRVLAYRPPVYFLEHNFQQELNFHNVMDTGLRKLAVKGVMLGYGVVLPLLVFIPGVAKLFSRFGIVAPPVALAPSFLATWYFYHDYPWSLTGEWAEMMLGLGFLFAAIVAWRTFRDGIPKAGHRGLLVAITTSWLLVVGVGIANAAISRVTRSASAGVVKATQTELEALRRDFLSGQVKTKCNRHRRLYTFKEKYGQDALLEGEFAALTTQGLPEERADFFLDPWNSPYWIRDRCDSDAGRRIVFIYSFGPNRRRESSRWEILGDDVGTIVYDGRRTRDITRSR